MWSMSLLLLMFIDIDALLLLYEITPLLRRLLFMAIYAILYYFRQIAISAALLRHARLLI